MGVVSLSQSVDMDSNWVDFSLSLDHHSDPSTPHNELLLSPGSDFTDLGMKISEKDEVGVGNLN